jgi:hypothetical protein
MEDPCGLVVGAVVTPADGRGERAAALAMPHRSQQRGCRSARSNGFPLTSRCKTAFADSASRDLVLVASREAHQHGQP